MMSYNAQLGSISASSDVWKFPDLNFRSARMPIMTALSVEYFVSASR